MEEESLESLRDQIRLLDLELVALATKRVALAKRVGEIKCRQGISTIDYAQERAVLDRARSAARERGLDPRVAEDLFTRLIRSSVSAQVEYRIRSAALGAGKSAVVIGGAGRMGRWLRSFLTALGYTTGVIDPAAARRELTDYFELTELHVHPDAQGRGVGTALLTELLSRVDAPRVLLSTPEGPTRAWRLYRRFGFTDLLRHYHFTGDSRDFAVLGRTLPL